MLETEIKKLTAAIEALTAATALRNDVAAQQTAVLEAFSEPVATNEEVPEIAEVLNDAIEAFDTNDFTERQLMDLAKEKTADKTFTRAEIKAQIKSYAVETISEMDQEQRNELAAFLVGL